MFTLLDKELNESDDEMSHFPYHQYMSKEKILSYLQQGKRLGQPKSCSDWLYEIMLQCWAFNIQDRLKCQDIEDRIKEKICL
ncbi:Proto-oncogene tyrosine- kinase receptor Ret [Paramuricea clavata]|uniref:Proto-oncogene tyrosine- kinase receptor Ret n=1 Tax=Paramuricea clavata TaxID=317549 RepID=A0A7D9LQW1_PARCT|nr:Proto-oncogene tyrosine- kinase receptor Ret [Paramuricea clavata]